MLLHRKVLEPEKPLFTMEIELEDINRNVLDQGAQILQLKHGIAYDGKYKAGKVPDLIWDYIKHFGFANYLKRTGYNYFDVEVYGKDNSSLIVPDPGKQPKFYRCKCGFPYMVPHEEYKCELIDKEDHFDVKVGGVKVAEYSDERKIGVLRKQIGWNWDTRAQFEPSRNRGFLYVLTRKV